MEFLKADKSIVFYTVIAFFLMSVLFYFIYLYSIRIDQPINYYKIEKQNVSVGINLPQQMSVEFQSKNDSFFFNFRKKLTAIFDGLMGAIQKSGRCM